MRGAASESAAAPVSHNATDPVELNDLCRTKLKLPYQTAGPLHMSPVDRAGSVSEISPRHSFLYKNFDVFI